MESRLRCETLSNQGVVDPVVAIITVFFDVEAIDFEFFDINFYRVGNGIFGAEVKVMIIFIAAFVVHGTFENTVERRTSGDLIRFFLEAIIGHLYGA